MFSTGLIGWVEGFFRDMDGDVSFYPEGEVGLLLVIVISTKKLKTAHESYSDIRFSALSLCVGENSLGT